MSEFPSKRDGWLVAVIWAAAAVDLVALAPILREPMPPLARAVGAVACAAAPPLMLWVLYGTRYRFEDGELLIRSGPFRWRVPIAELESVAPSRNPLASPACSLDRLDVRFRRSGRERRVLISPSDREGFLRALLERAPALERRGDRLEGRGGGPGRNEAHA